MNPMAQEVCHLSGVQIKDVSEQLPKYINFTEDYSFLLKPNLVTSSVQVRVGFATYLYAVACLPILVGMF